MKDRIPTYPGRVRLTRVDGETYIYDMERADHPIEPGTPMNKNSLLSDETALFLGMTSDDPTPNEAFGKLSEKSNRSCSVVIGTSTAGWTNLDCDFLCDGTNDSSIIDTAVNKAKRGGEIAFLRGNYNLTKQIILPTESVLRGSGYGTCLIKKFSEGGASVSDNAILARGNCKISNLRISGNSRDNAYNIGIMSNSTGAVIENVYFDKCGTCVALVAGQAQIIGCDFQNSGNLPNAVAINPQSSANNIIKNNTINNYRNGVFSTGGTSNLVIANNAFTQCGTGISLGGGAVRCVGNFCSECSIGIESKGYEWYISGNICIDCDTGIKVTGSRTNITGNTIRRGGGMSADYSDSQHTLLVEAGSANNLIIANIFVGKNFTNAGGEANTFINDKYIQE